MTTSHFHVHTTASLVVDILTVLETEGTPWSTHFLSSPLPFGETMY